MGSAFTPHTGYLLARTKPLLVPVGTGSAAQAGVEVSVTASPKPLWPVTGEHVVALATTSPDGTLIAFIGLPQLEALRDRLADAAAEIERRLGEAPACR